MAQLKYILAKDAANKWGISQSKIATLCSENKISGAEKLGDRWIIPRDLDKSFESNDMNTIVSDNKAKPFIKWAGGKTQLLPILRKNYPIGLGSEITKYCEPMVGAGAVLFDIVNNYNIEEILICDCNFELINLYNTIKNNVNLLVERLFEYEKTFLSFDKDSRKINYYELRDRYNQLIFDAHEKNEIERASLFLFLNKTCFNGLYRVNKKGLFNVPMGSYKNPTICDENNLFKVSRILNNIDIIKGDFKDTLNFIDERTFVYIDPPYRPLNKTSEFTSYNSQAFDDNEQIRLEKYFESLDLKKAKVMLSNSDPKNTDENDNFFDALYQKYKIQRINAKRVINSKGNARGILKELLIKNY